MKSLTEDEAKALMGTDAYQNKYNPKFEETQCLVRQGWKNLYPDDDRNENPDNYYIWNAVVDDRTRSSHAERDGQVFCWDKPPEGGHPGEEYNCRCTAEPYEPPKEAKVSNYDKAIYGLASTSQGYSLGFSDEIEGLINGAGHVIAKGSDKIYTKAQPYLVEKYPNLPKNIYDPNKGFVDAFKEGYKSQRDESRSLIKEGKEKAPVVSVVSEVTGAISNPIKFAKIGKLAPPKVVSRKNLIDAAVGGAVYGIGTGEGGVKEHVINAGIGAVGGAAGNSLSQKFDRAFSRIVASQALRHGMNKSVEQGVNNIIEDTVKKSGEYKNKKY